MRYLLMLLLLPLLLNALELSVQSGKEENRDFSLLHLKDSELFLCEAQKDDFDVTTSVICAFSKRPIHPLSKIENSFFTVNSKLQDKTFFIVITPKKKMELYSLLFDLIEDDEVYQVQNDRSKHWVVVGYDETLPLLKPLDRQNSSLNLPIPFADTRHPYVGGLDMLGNPIHMTRVKDVSDYLSIKKSYQERDYTKALSLITEVLNEYPDTIFKSELILYQIRCYHELGQYESLIQSGKEFIREYSADLNMAEVLVDIAHAYSKVAMYTDADYFFDRLFDEHADSDFAHRGMIYKGEQFESSGYGSKAVMFYEKALYEAKDRTIASTAAYHLSQYYLDVGQAKKAAGYAEMILGGNRNFFSNTMDSSIEMALKFASNNHFKMAADIAGALLESMERSDDNYEELLKNRGMWLAETDAKEEAVEAFNTYLSKFRFGEYAEDIKRAKDALFFDVNDENSSQRLSEYEMLMHKYEGDSIAKRALYEKAKLLLEMHEYDAVLQIKAALEALDPTLYEDVETIIQMAALGLIEVSLENKACEKVVMLSENYDINLSAKWDEGLYECFMAAGNFEAAKQIATSHLQSKVYDERVAWLERYLKIDFSLGNYTAASDAARELIALHGKERDDLNGPVYRLLFDASQRLGDSDGMIDAIARIERTYGVDYNDIERYTQMVTVAKDRSDDVMLENFAAKVMELQKRAQSFTQTPYIEFTLTQALIDDGKNAQALEVLSSLSDRNISNAKRARQYYLMGTLYQKEKNPTASRTAFEKSIAADTNSSWGKLATDALKLIR